MSPTIEILLYGVLRPILPKNPFASCYFINLYFLLPHIAHFDNNISLPFLVSNIFQSIFFVFFWFFFLHFKQYVNMFHND